MGMISPPPIVSTQQRKSGGPYVKVVAVHGLIVQGDSHPDANVRFPLDRCGGDDEVLRVVPHQVHLKHAVQALGQNGEKAVRGGSGGQGQEQRGFVGGGCGAHGGACLPHTQKRSGLLWVTLPPVPIWALWKSPPVPFASVLPSDA